MSTSRSEHASDASARAGASQRTSREVFWIIAACIAMTQMSWGTIVPVLPVYADQFGASAFELGVVVAAFSLARLIVNIPAANLASRVDRRVLLVVSVLGVFAVLSATAFAQNLPTLIALRIALGLAGGTAITTGQGLIGDITDIENRGRAMATLQGLQLAGGSIGPAVGGIAAGAFGVRGAFFISGLAALAVGVWALVRLPSFRPGDANEGQRASSFSLLRDRNYLISCAVSFTVALHRFGGQHTLLPLIAYATVGLSVSQFGLLLSAVTGINLLTVRFVGSISDRRGRKAVLVPSLFAAGCAYPLYVSSSNPTGFVVAALIVGALTGFSGPTPAAYTADLAPPGRMSQAIGVFRSFNDLAGLIGPVAIGLCIDAAGFGAATWGIAALTVATSMLLHFKGVETAGPHALRPASF